MLPGFFHYDSYPKPFVESDAACTNSARVFASLGRHITTQTSDKALVKKYTDLASIIFKLAANTFPQCALSGAIALATSDLSADSYPDSILDTVKQHISLFENTTIPPDFIFFTTMVFVELAKEGGAKNKTKTGPLLVQLMGSEVFMKEKFLTGLSSKGSFNFINMYDKLKWL